MLWLTFFFACAWEGGRGEHKSRFSPTLLWFHQVKENQLSEVKGPTTSAGIFISLLWQDQSKHTQKKKRKTTIESPITPLTLLSHKQTGSYRPLPSLPPMIERVGLLYEAFWPNSVVE